MVFPVDAPHKPAPYQYARFADHDLRQPGKNRKPFPAGQVDCVARYLPN